MMEKTYLNKGKQFLKYNRWHFRRFITAMKYGPRNLADSPIVFGNAMPKSGSHLLTQILSSMIRIGPFVDPGFPPVNRDERNQPLDGKQIVSNLQSMNPGDIRYGYIHAKEPFLSILTQPDYATIFIYRDPRDMLISHIFYAKDMYLGHGMHHYYTKKLTTMEERINAAIEGVEEPGYELASVRKRYNSYLGWLEQSQILCLKFEDLVMNSEATIERMIDYLEHREARITCSRSRAIEILKESIQPEKSGTFRKGIPGDWKKHFSEKNKEVFKQVAGELLQQLGYEDSNQW